MTTKTVAKKTYPTFGPTVVTVSRNGTLFHLGRGDGRVTLTEMAEIMEAGDVDVVTSWTGETFQIERTAKAFVTTGRFAFDGAK